MCFENRRIFSPLVSLAVLAALAFTGCGKKGDPLPPLRDVPAKSTDLALEQQGRLILLELSYPALTVDGMALEGIDAVELHELIKPAVAEKPLPIEAPEFESGAAELLTLRGAELQAAVTGSRIQIRLPLAEELPEEPAVHYFGVRTVKGDETSPFSNVVALVPREPPPPPADLDAVAEADGILLRWKSDEEVEGFDVFRRDARERGYGEPLGRTGGDQTVYRDRTAVYGKSYIYTVRAVATRDPLIWSNEAGEREINYEDRFAPPLPKNFVALGERGRVRLRWEKSESPDVAGYVLYRREPRREFHRLTDDLLKETEYLDRGLVSGYSYDYRIQVVDQLGNESELSEPVTVAVR